MRRKIGKVIWLGPVFYLGAIADISFPLDCCPCSLLYNVVRWTRN